MPDTLSHLYSLTPAQVEYLRKNPTFRSCRLDAGWDASVLASASDTEKICYAFRGDTNLRCRVMRVRGGPPDEDPKLRLNAILRQLRRYKETGKHANLIDIKGADVGILEDALQYFRLVSECSSLTVMEYIQLHPNSDRHKMCMEIAAGLDHLHAHSIVHGAIRGSNILVKPDNTFCIGEFSDEQIPSEQTLVTYANWTAPELFDVQRLKKMGVDGYRDEYSGEFQMPSDIYALGCTVIELYTGAPPGVQRIPHDTKLTQFDLFKLTRVPSEEENNSIPFSIQSIIDDMLLFIPFKRPYSNVVCQWFEKPNARRLRNLPPALAKLNVPAARRQ